MIYALKVLLKEPADYLQSVVGRKFVSLCSRFGDIPRNSSRTFKLFGQLFTFLDSWSFLWQFHEIFYKKSYLFKTNNRAPIIIDCGANIGTSILFFKKRFPESKVFAFEANSRVFATLKSNIGHLEGVELHQKAVWLDDKGVVFDTDGVDTGHISQVDGKAKSHVESISLKNYLSEFEEIDFLKMDIEGAEFEILEDCKDCLSHVKNVFIEVHTFSGLAQRVAGLLHVLEASGFRYFIENENQQKSPLKGDWRTNEQSMDVQMNIYGIRVE